MTSRRRATTKASGGGGFTFADKVAAGFLAQMLRRKFPLEPELGSITEVHFETRDVGNLEAEHLLDDLLLVLNNGSQETRCALSVKSNRQLTNKGFDRTFVEDAWEQRNCSQSGVKPETDIFGLVVGAISDRALHQWRELQKQAASTTPERLIGRLAPHHAQSSKVQREMFKSLHKSKDPDTRDLIETALLASQIRVLPFSSDRETDSINLCSEIVFDGSQQEGNKLWSRLLELASESRKTGGYFDLPKLIRNLRPDFELQDHPNFDSDWNRLELVSLENQKAVRTVIDANIHLDRKDEKATLAAEIQQYKVTAITGESGSGKSAVVAQLVAPGGRFTRVLWLNGGQLSKSSQTDLAHTLNLRHSIPELIVNSCVQNCVLVMDGFEKFEGDAHWRAIELIKAVREEGFIHWKLIVTCQPQFWELLQDSLVEADISDVHKLDFEKPNLEQVFQAVGHLPGMRALLLRGELQAILKNLMVLDWVLRAEVAQRFSAHRRWIGETEVIERIWDRWIGQDRMKLARDSLLRALGQREGDVLSGAVHIDTIPSDQLPLLGDLTQEGLVRVSNPSVQFSHDQMGDWARFRTLKFAGNQAPQTIKNLAHIPRWGRAIRLYAQSLAEQGKGLEEWKSVAMQVAGDDPQAKLASDLFLDGLLFAANSEALLEQVWADLIADRGQILHRILNRLLHVASFPDSRFRGLVDYKFAEQSEEWFRIPFPLYWFPALRVLSSHVQDVAKHALFQAAAVCELWLRTMPAGMPGRREAGLLALELARETQSLIAEGMRFDGQDQKVYEAFLSAAHEFPEDVTQIALEISARRPVPAHAIQRAREERDRQARLRDEWRKHHPEERRANRALAPPFFSFPRGPMGHPAADGPRRRVSEGFRSAVLDTTALYGLISVRPEIAREVLLAVCIEEPTHSDPYSNPAISWDERLGLAHWQLGYPAMYWKGPFLNFLQNAPEQGLDAIIRLVNYATKQLFEDDQGPSTEGERKAFEQEFEIGGKTVRWLGDANVYGWHRYAPLQGNAVGCALMALEKWLYDEIETHRNVTKWVEYIFGHAESVAFVGVLVSLGSRYMPLFTRELQPLLGNFYIYSWQMSWAISELHESWRISLGHQDLLFMDQAIEWHSMLHRRILMRDFVPHIMLQHQGTRKYVSQRKIGWAKQIEKSYKERVDLEFFFARFDLQNYTTVTHPDGRVVITMRWPAHLERKAQESQTESKIKMLSLGLAQRARRLLDSQESLRSEELPEFAGQIQELANWQRPAADQFDEHYRVDSIAGGIAVLVIKHRKWLSQNSELERWCLDTLQQLKPVDSEDTPTSILSQSAELFLGEAGVALLQESSEEWVLRNTFEGVTGYFYNSTLYTMWRAYLLREQLGEKFGELVNLVVLWSALRRAAIAESGYDADRALLTKYKGALFQRYTAGRLKGPLISLRHAEILGQRLMERIARRSSSNEERLMREELRESIQEDREHDHKLDRDIPDIDLAVIQKGFGFVAAMVRNPLTSANQTLEQYIRELFELEMRTFSQPASDDIRCEISGTPYEFDRWVMLRVAEYMARANSLEIGRTLYQPILALGPAGRYWVEDFLHAWITVGLEISPDLEGFAGIWKDMVEHVMTLPAWQSGNGEWSRAESLSVDLMGLHESTASILGQTKYIGLILTMAPVFEQWATQWLRYASAAAWFAAFLPTESGRVLLSKGIKLLDGVVSSFGDSDWHRYSIGRLFTEALAAGWKYLQIEVGTQSDLRTAFLNVLTELCAKQTPEALHLRSKVSEIFGPA